MTTLTARGYMTSRLTPEQRAALHRSETEAGLCKLPSEIKKRFFLPDLGEVSPEVGADLDRRCLTIFEKARAAYRARHTGCCFPLPDGTIPRSSTNCPAHPDVALAHEFDRQLILQAVEFKTTTANGGTLRQIMGIK
jgi:hypothetical protein